MVGVNVPIPVPSPITASVGGRSSLFGDARMYRPEGVKSYTAPGRHLPLARPRPLLLGSGFPPNR